LTTWLPDHRDGLSDRPATVDLDGFALAVADLLAEADAARDWAGVAAVEAVLSRRLTEPQFAAVFDATPIGTDATADELLRRVREHWAAGGPAGRTLLRTLLLSQVDSVWWGRTPPYRSDADLRAAEELVDLDGARREGTLAFRYRTQPSGLAGRLAHAAQRRILPGRRPHTAGLRFTRTRPAMAILLNRLAQRFRAEAPAGTPPLWVTSLARSVAHQIRLAALGYPAMLPSAHCVGYAADVEMAWYRRFGADGTLAGVLLDARAAGELNVIDEGQVWHVCLHPDAAARLTAAGTGIGG
jgi:hypothetical protein